MIKCVKKGFASFATREKICGNKIAKCEVNASFADFSCFLDFAFQKITGWMINKKMQDFLGVCGNNNVMSLKI